MTVRAEDGPLTVRLEPCAVVVGRVVDGKGKKMSKSLGNVIEPLAEVSTLPSAKM